MEKDTNRALKIACFWFVVLLILSAVAFFVVKNAAHDEWYDTNGKLYVTDTFGECSSILIVAFVNFLISIVANFFYEIRTRISGFWTTLRYCILAVFLFASLLAFIPIYEYIDDYDIEAGFVVSLGFFTFSLIWGIVVLIKIMKKPPIDIQNEENLKLSK